MPDPLPPPSPIPVGLLQMEIVALLEHHGIGQDLIDDVLLAVKEAEQLAWERQQQAAAES